MRQFRFRVWSTTTGERVLTDTQDQALRIHHNTRHMDRIDYRTDDGYGWRYVDPNELHNVGIDAIYEVDAKHDGARLLIIVTVGFALLVAGLGWMIFSL